jgi:hypothetical protein
MVNHRSGGSGGVVRTANAQGSVSTRSPKVRSPARASAQERAILCQVLDGQVTRRAAGFAAESCDRVMFIPFETTCDAAVALVITKMQGLISAKLDKMEPEAADILYATTLPLPDSEN